MTTHPGCWMFVGPLYTTQGELQDYRCRATNTGNHRQVFASGGVVWTEGEWVCNTSVAVADENLLADFPLFSAALNLPSLAECINSK